MNTETALTSLCITTVMLIVGLVVMTSVHIQPTVIGQYLGSPVVGQMFPRVPFTHVDVNPSDQLCYQNAVVACQGVNVGQSFVLCANEAARDCNLPLGQSGKCHLPVGFEQKYPSKRDCGYGVIDECRAFCPVAHVNDCVQISKSRCSLIGITISQP